MNKWQMVLMVVANYNWMVRFQFRYFFSFDVETEGQVDEQAGSVATSNRS
jgi:hypothetical protein